MLFTKALRRLASFLMRLFIFAARFLTLGYFEFRGFEQLKNSGGCILIANHPGILDALMLLTRCPDIVFIYKNALKKNLFFSYIPRALGHIPNSDGIETVKQIIEIVKNGGIVAIFPEGHRTVHPPVGEFKPSFASVAIRAGVPVQTVVIRNDAKLFARGRSFFAPCILPLYYTFTIGRRFDAEVAESPLAFSNRIQQYIRDSL